MCFLIYPELPYIVSTCIRAEIWKRSPSQKEQHLVLSVIWSFHFHVTLFAKTTPRKSRVLSAASERPQQLTRWEFRWSASQSEFHQDILSKSYFFVFKRPLTLLKIEKKVKTKMGKQDGKPGQLFNNLMNIQFDNLFWVIFIGLRPI